ncbi:MAG: dipeptide epimerase, partial [Myxococcales bacterium]|nr:dipeptide epimerase [Myxococcales bacterium]
MERWPLREPFSIARGSKTEAVVVVVTLEADGHQGRGECVPYARYGESLDSVEAQIAGLPETFTRADLPGLLEPGAARNAVDCALFDLHCKERGIRAWDLAGRDEPAPSVTVETVVIDSPDAMREAARACAHRPILKVKLDAEQVVERMRAVREGAPQSRLVVDANEAWDENTIVDLLRAAAEMHIALIEQPLPAGQDAILRDIPHPVPICA